MDKIQFQCPGCAIVLSAPAEKAGKTRRCPSCGSTLQIPQTPDSFKPNPVATPESSITANRPVTLACPRCASPLQVTRQLAGKAALQQVPDIAFDSR